MINALLALPVGIAVSDRPPTLFTLDRLDLLHARIFRRHTPSSTTPVPPILAFIVIFVIFVLPIVIIASSSVDSVRNGRLGRALAPSFRLPFRLGRRIQVQCEVLGSSVYRCVPIETMCRIERGMSELSRLEAKEGTYRIRRSLRRNTAQRTG